MILKHVASKSASYSATMKYMEYEHDPKTKEVLKDEKGNEVKRDFLCDVVNVQSRETWVIECNGANSYYDCNKEKGDVKQHQYIISFSEEEVKKYNLTPEKVMEIGKEWTNKSLPNHQAILYVHKDGHNHSGNLHVHVNINSVRIQDCEKQEWMNNQKKFYTEGMKHTCTAKYRYSAIENLNRISQERGYEMTVQNKTDKKINEKEYWTDKRGKEKDSNFDTQKEELRQCIRATVPLCMSGNKLNEELFKKKMQEDYDITVTESRGRFSYMHPAWKDKRKKPVTDKNLGESYKKENIINGFSKQNDRTISERNSARAGAGAEQRTSRPITTEEVVRADNYLARRNNQNAEKVDKQVDERIRSHRQQREDFERVNRETETSRNQRKGTRADREPSHEKNQGIERER